ncbi:MAG TPA: hypothetical protein VE618_12235, partial [Myxococcaceae bacterium]|nr:hypothetical protein [Myxococcaceae bacterium]
MIAAAGAVLGGCGVDGPESELLSRMFQQGVEQRSPALQEIDGLDTFVPALTPIAAQGRQGRQVRVVLKLTGDPVARVVGRDRSRVVSKAEQRRIASALKANQSATARAVEQHGGKVLAQYQWAYNGLKVEIGRERLTSLRQLPGVEDVKPVEVFERTHQNSV